MIKNFELVELEVRETKIMNFQGMTSQSSQALL
jgi:hypothetical protein